MTITVTFYQNMIISLAIFNLIASLLLLFWPNLLIKMNDVLSKWFSTDKIEAALNKRHNIDQSIMGLRKVFGIMSILFSFILIYLLVKR